MRGAGNTERESAVHHIYMLANSITTTRTSSSVSKNAISTNKRKHSDMNDERLSSITNEDDEKESPVKQSRLLGTQVEIQNSRELRVIERIASMKECIIPWFLNSLCPLIYGHELVKLGLLLGLFGGAARGDSMDRSSLRYNDQVKVNVSRSSFSTRSDIHVLIVGDPGLGKSQLLRSAAEVAPKSVFVCGNTATTAGLTVSLTRDSAGSTRGGGGSDVCIEAGALVLADKGVCCIDELDKMNCDPHSMLEAMEQQQISVAKSGVVTSLKSRTSVLAAANPVGGHYNRNKSVSIVEAILHMYIKLDSIFLGQ